ncbi:MAG TPA: 4-(cytidine 5'-diphospho)-2-C-methyl-D-erythritol kinase [Abditibacterium sp.]|jgi:4-diphosphocytidyl-2-C-methyl-D-erythritol kinase
MKIEVRSAAKVNLTLDILSRRADGYHELASVVHTIGIWDEIAVETQNGSEIAFGCNREDLSGSDNLCVRAAKMWQEAAGENFGLQIHLEKRIPSGAGLGGGSGNAAAILLALNRFANRPLDAPKLHEIGAKLGADVPLFLEGGAVLMEGIGEKLTPLAALIGCVLVVKPAVSFATPAIFRRWDDGDLQSRRDTASLLEVWDGNLDQIAARTGNDLVRAVASFSEVPRQLVALLRDCGALGAQMSGSGSACFGIFGSDKEAQTASDALKSELAKDVHLASTQRFVAPFCERGVEFLAP